MIADARAHHKSSVSREQFLEELRVLLQMKGKLVTMRLKKQDGTRYTVLTSKAATAVRDVNKFWRKVKGGKLKRVYGIFEILDASEASSKILQRMSPPPLSVAPFLLEGRFTVFFTVCPPDQCLNVLPHVDKDGSGPLVYGPSIHGACTSVAVCAPNYDKRSEQAPPGMQNVFTSIAVPAIPSLRQQRPIHVVNMSVSGAQINLPAGAWHAVRSYGSSIRIGYYFLQRGS